MSLSEEDERQSTWTDGVGPRPSRRPLHFILIADCSRSMIAHGKIQALNNAVREVLPHIAEAVEENPHAEALIRVVAFSTGARWHVQKPTPVRELVWTELRADGYTDMGAAIDLVVEQLRAPHMPARALAPALLLISDGFPTDDYRAAIGRLLEEPWGRRAIRLAVGIGGEVDNDVLQEFIASDDARPVSAKNPQQLIRMLRWASVLASKAASMPSLDPRHQFAQPTPADPVEGLTW